LLRANVATEVFKMLLELRQEADLETIRVGLVTSEADRSGLSRYRRSGCLDGRFIRGSGGL
jgi:hypothetical protein